MWMKHHADIINALKLISQYIKKGRETPVTTSPPLPTLLPPVRATKKRSASSRSFTVLSVFINLIYCLSTFYLILLSPVFQSLNKNRI